MRHQLSSSSSSSLLESRSREPVRNPWLLLQSWRPLLLLRGGRPPYSGLRTVEVDGGAAGPGCCCCSRCCGRLAQSLLLLPLPALCPCKSAPPVFSKCLPVFWYLGLGGGSDFS